MLSCQALFRKLSKLWNKNWCAEWGRKCPAFEYVSIIFKYLHTHIHKKTIFLFHALSLSQTKDALFTILRDLRPGDHFNFISFSNKIKVWQPNRLVPVTPLNVRDAKKFIYTLATTGGETLLSLWLVFFMGAYGILIYILIDKQDSVCWINVLSAVDDKEHLNFSWLLCNMYVCTVYVLFG